MSAPSRFVREAMKRRVDAGLCPVCGGEMVRPRILRIGKDKPEQLTCVNYEDGRHPRPGGKKLKVKLK